MPELPSMAANTPHPQGATIPPTAISMDGQSLLATSTETGIKTCCPPRPFADGPADTRFSSGDAHLVFGRPRSTIDSLYDLTIDADISIYGANSADRLGFSAALADLDNDGYDDIIMGTPLGVDSTRVLPGEIYVFFGGPRTTMARNYDLRFVKPDIRILGESSRRIGGENFDIAGDEVVSFGLATGDINGDGHTDLVFSSVHGRGPLGTRVSGGAVYAVLGRPRCELPSFVDCDFRTSATHPDFVVHGGDAGDRFGFEIVCADLDGDGVDDLVSTAYGGDGRENLRISAGDIYGFWGRREWRTQYDIARDEFDFAIEGPTAGYRLGTGDLDGDGIDDLVVGSFENENNENLPDGQAGAGEHRVLFGRSRGQWPRWTDLVPATDVLILGADTGDTRGPFIFEHTFFLATGDRNADGFYDLLITAGGADGPPWSYRDNGGEAYLLYGRPRSAWEPFYDLRSDYDLIAYGADGFADGVGAYHQDEMGWACAMADIDGNGRDEIILSSTFADGPLNTRTDAGEVYIVFDPDSTVSMAQPPSHNTPSRVVLHPNYPNPFNGSTHLSFSAPEGSEVTIQIFDAFGRRIATPMNHKTVSCSDNDMDWVAEDGLGKNLPSGVYFVRLKAAGETHSQKIIFLK